MTKNIENATVASNEVNPAPQRRRFTAAYKAGIIARAEGCTQSGELGALLRSEGLYSSHLSKWRTQVEAGTLAALGRKRGPKANHAPDADKLSKLERENAKLRRKLAHAEKVIDVQKKLSEILGVTLDPLSEDESESN